PVAGGNTVTVTGSNFVVGATTVTVDGVTVPAAEVTVVSATELTYVAPAHAAGPVAVTVTTAGGTSGPLTYTYVEIPTLGSLDPDAGPVAGGQTVTVTGSGFVSGLSTVTVDGSPVPATDVTVVSSTELTYVTPAHAAGQVDVSVT